jgi:regulator of protease activity HflC (stomatin/prohibitin superfamily)
MMLPAAVGTTGCSVNDSGEISVKYGVSKGTHDTPRGEGIVWYVPFFQENLKYDGTTQSVKETIKNQSADNIEVDVDVNIQWKIKPEKLPEIQAKHVGSSKHNDATSTGEDLGVENMIPNPRNRALYTKLVRQALRARLGDQMKLYKGEVMNDNRDKIQAALLRGYQDVNGNHVPSLVDEMERVGVEIINVEVRRVELPKDMQAKIRERAEALIEEQTAETKVRIAEQQAQADQKLGEGRGKAKAAEALGEAEAIRTRGEALKDFPEVLELNRVEAEKEAGKNGGLIIVPRNSNSTIMVAPKGQ